jgi:hypothetical protein
MNFSAGAFSIEAGVSRSKRPPFWGI